MADFFHFASTSPILASLLISALGLITLTMWSRFLQATETIAHRICGTLERIHRPSETPHPQFSCPPVRPNQNRSDTS